MAKQTITLAKALLIRKELNNKVAQLSSINRNDLYEVKTVRKPAHEGIDDVIATVPKITAAEVAHAYDHHARLLRQVDAVIQQANWNTPVEVPADATLPYSPPAK